MPEIPFSSLIDKIYAAAENGLAWPSVLEALGDSFGGAACGFTYNEKENSRTRVTASVRLDPDCVKDYNAYYHKLDLFTIRGSRVQVPDLAFASGEYLADEELAGSEYFNDFLRKQGLFYNLGASLSVDASAAICYVTILRSKRLGAFTASETRLLTRLLPHLSRAVRLHKRISGLESSVDAFDALTIGVVAVEVSGRPVFINRAAAAILKEDDGLRLTPKGLIFLSGKQYKPVSELLKTGSELRDDGRSTRHFLAVDRPSGKRPYVMEISRPSSRLAAAFEAPTAAIWITDPERSAGFEHERFRSHFNLTSAESRLATLLAAGKSLTAAADHLHLSRNTLRTQLRSIFAKANVKRQAELVALLSRFGKP